MSTRRVSKEAGWVNLKTLPRGPNGRALCRQCGKEVPGGRRSFCGQPCVEQWRVRTDPGYLRRLVFDRDRGVCALCLTDVFKQANRTPRVRSGDLWQADHVLPVVEGGGECDLANLRTLCTACHKRETAKLAARRARERRIARPLPLLDAVLPPAPAKGHP